MNKLLIITLALIASGCATTGESLVNLTSGSIGCQSSKLKITDEQHHIETYVTEYVAECNGKKFVCTHINIKEFGEPTHAPTCTPMIGG